MRRILREIGIGLLLAVVVVAVVALVRPRPRKAPGPVSIEQATAWSEAWQGLGSADVSVRRRAAHRLFDLAYRMPVAWGTPPAEWARLAARVRDRGEDQAVRLEVMGVLDLARYRNRAGDTAKLFRERILDPEENPKLGAAAAEILGTLGPQGFEMLHAVALDCPSAPVRDAAVEAVVQSAPPSADLFDMLSRAARDPAPEVASAAIRGLAARHAGDPRIVPIFAEALRDRPPGARDGVLRTLWLDPQPIPEDLRPLIASLLEAEDARLRVLAALVLFEHAGDLGALGILLDGLGSHDREVRTLADMGLAPNRGPESAADPRRSGLKGRLRAADPTTRARAAVLLAGDPAVPIADFESVLFRDLAFCDAETRLWARPFLRVRAAERPWLARELGGRPSPAPADLGDRHVLLWLSGLIGLFFLLGWGIVLGMRRQDAGRTPDASEPADVGPRHFLNVTLPPVRITLRAEPTTAWREAEAIEAATAQFRALGFEEVGSFFFSELPDVKLRGFVRPADGIGATVHESGQRPFAVEFYSEYADGRGFTCSNLPVLVGLSRPSSFRLVALDTRDIGALLGHFLANRPVGPARPITLNRFASQYERVHADLTDWRNSRGGWTADDLRILAAWNGLEVDDRMIADCLDRLAPAAVGNLELGLCFRYLDREGIEGADADAMFDRLVIVHDGMLPQRMAELFFEQVDDEFHAVGDQGNAIEGIDFVDEPEGAEIEELSPRREFEQRNRRRPGDLSYLKIGELDWPVEADVYLAPESAR